MTTAAPLGFAVAALLLVLGGGLKLQDPSGTVGALRALGAPANDLVVRVLAGVEVLVGGSALVTTHRVVTGLVAVSYGGFAVVVAAALARGAPIDSCGCLGRLDTQPSWRHIVVVVALLGCATAQIVVPEASVSERLSDDGAAGAWFALASVACTAAAVWLLANRRPSPSR